MQDSGPPETAGELYVESLIKIVPHYHCQMSGFNLNALNHYNLPLSVLFIHSFFLFLSRKHSKVSAAH